jgi:hypothetical protein
MRRWLAAIALVAALSTDLWPLVVFGLAAFGLLWYFRPLGFDEEFRK